MHDQNAGRVSWKAMFSVAVALLAGCSNPGGLPEGETGTVSGKVTHDGKPISQGANVVFVNEKYGIVATGTITADGAYSLQMRGGPEILAGEYRVSVSEPATDQTEMTEEQYKRFMNPPSDAKPPKSKEMPEIPEKYRTPETSGLTFQVKAGENSGVDFNLED